MKIRLTIALFLLLINAPFYIKGQAENTRAARVINEKQPVADLGNGYFKNPVNLGGWGDPTAVKVGDDYYLAHTVGNGIMTWHSRDLVNWRPLVRHSLGEGFSNIWASDLVYFNNKFHFYMPIGIYPGKSETEKNHRYFKSVWVITAEEAEGPWSKPIRVDMHYNPDPFYTGIDPGFIQTPEGKKYLYVDNGFMMPLTDDGLSSTAMPKVVYEGWKYPEEWVVQGKCLESPKLFYKDGYYYICSAMGGTSGPSTAHMATVSRSKSPEGPWETSPYNPLVRTYTEEEPFWHMGHATILEGPGAEWYALFPARFAWYVGMGKQTCILPLEWTNDGWPRAKAGLKPWDLLPMPKGENVGHGMPLSDNFNTPLGIQWNVAENDKPFISSGNGKLLIKGSKDNASRSVNVRAINKSYEVIVEVEVKKGTVAGLSFGNNEGLKTDGKTIRYISEEEWRVRDSEIPIPQGNKIFLKIRNYRQDLSFFGSTDGITWKHFQNGVRAADYTVNLFVTGEGEAIFSNFTYIGLEQNR